MLKPLTVIFVLCATSALADINQNKLYLSNDLTMLRFSTNFFTISSRDILERQYYGFRNVGEFTSVYKADCSSLTYLTKDMINSEPKANELFQSANKSMEKSIEESKKLLVASFDLEKFSVDKNVGYEEPKQFKDQHYEVVVFEKGHCAARSPSGLPNAIRWLFIDHNMVTTIEQNGFYEMVGIDCMSSSFKLMVQQIKTVAQNNC